MIPVVLALVIAATAADPSAAPSGPRIGDPAPDFTLPYATRDSISGEDLKLSTLFGKGPIVLAFYPADWSGGCTREVCTFRDNFTSLGGLHAQVLGLSGDYVFSHYEWAKHHNLPFTLVSDHKHEVAKTYASYNDQTGHDKRTVYVIDKSGKIAYIDLAYSTRDSVSFGKLQAALKNVP
jgi:peroxiredoxin Q/BCP